MLTKTTQKTEHLRYWSQWRTANTILSVFDTLLTQKIS